MNIYVGNLSRDAAEQDLQQAFAGFGQVASAVIIKDKFSGESRGFGFVEMPAKEEAAEAVAGTPTLTLKMERIAKCSPLFLFGKRNRRDAEKAQRTQRRKSLS